MIYIYKILLTMQSNSCQYNTLSLRTILKKNPIPAGSLINIHMLSFKKNQNTEVVLLCVSLFFHPSSENRDSALVTTAYYQQTNQCNTLDLDSSTSCLFNYEYTQDKEFSSRFETCALDKTKF